MVADDGVMVLAVAGPLGVLVPVFILYALGWIGYGIAQRRTRRRAGEGSSGPANRVSRSTIILMAAAAVSLVVAMVASAAPWPVEGPAGFVWGAGLIAVGVAYLIMSRHELSPSEIAWGLVLATLSWFVPLILNQLLNFPALHRFHKLLASIVAFLMLVAWTTARRFHTGRHQPRG